MLNIRYMSHRYENRSNLGLIILNDEQTKKVQSLTYNIYIDIVRFCKTQGLRFSLAGGSALGAVRHKGIIPWDDDIDLIMPREDFDKFMCLFNEGLGSKYYMACPNKKYSNQYNYIIKVIDRNTQLTDIFKKSNLFYQGLAVDIQAIDFVPNNKLLYGIKGLILNMMLFLVNSNMMYHCQTQLSKKLFTQTIISSLYYYGRIFIGFVISFIPYNKLCFLFDRFSASNHNKQKVSIPSGRNHYFKETHPVDVFFPFVEVDFEGDRSYIPNDSDKYLTALYGPQYMEIPPENKREKHLCSKIEL